MNHLKQYLWHLVGALVGALAGLLYWRLVGCSSGTCPLTANPYLSMFWFGLVGLLLGSSGRKRGRHADRKE
jgi:hypothetical protein